MRYFLEIAYEGTDYHGWQIQPNAITVQQVLNDCLSTILRQEIQTIGSGRTDTGVHASQQFVHFDVEQQLDIKEACYRFNRILPHDIVVNNMFEVGPESHARFDAISRTYEYRICLKKNPFVQHYTYYLSRQPDVANMNEAAKRMLQAEDFTTFSKVKGDVLNHRCHMMEACWVQDGEMLIFTIRANRFLRGMVRLVVGTLLDVGSAKLSVEAFGELLKQQDRRKASGAAPAQGLFLTRVEYPEHYFETEKLKNTQLPN